MTPAWSAVALLLGAMDPAARPMDATVCEVLSRPESFDGKIVRIADAVVIAGFDEFVIEGAGCTPRGAIWLSYPRGTGGKAGPAAFVRLQPSKDSALSGTAKRGTVRLRKDKEFMKFDSLLAAPSRSGTGCLACPRYRVVATLVGLLDGVGPAGVERDAGGSVTAIRGFGNLSLYRARLVLQSVAGVAAVEIDPADTRKASRVGVSETARRRAGAAFGREGDANGVIIGAGVANETPDDEGTKAPWSSPDGVVYRVTFDNVRLGGAALAAALVHVGTHIADLRERRVPPVLDALEFRAWQATPHD